MNAIQRHNRRGTVMMEFVFCIPLLAIIFLGIFFFGHLMRNQQRLRTSDRYVAWRITHNNQARIDGNNHAYYEFGEPDETAERDGFVTEYNSANYVNLSGSLLDEELVSRFFTQTKIEEITHDQHNGPEDTINSLVQLVGERNSDAGNFANRATQSWPHGIACRIDGIFPSEISMLERLEKQARGHESTGRTETSSSHPRRHLRDGVQWRRGQSSYRETIRQEFLQEFDSVVNQVTIPQLKENLEHLYLEQW